MGAITILAPVWWPPGRRLARPWCGRHLAGYAMRKEMKARTGGRAPASQGRQPRAAPGAAQRGGDGPVGPRPEHHREPRGGDRDVFAGRARQGDVVRDRGGHSQAALQAMGEELSKRVVQKYVYQKIMNEIKTRQFLVVEEETDTNNAIQFKGAPLGELIMPQREFEITIGATARSSCT